MSSRDGALDAPAQTVEAPAPPDADTSVTASQEEAAPRVTVIRPAPRWPHLDVPELWHYRELLFRLAWRDVAVRYKQTLIGIAWAILQPFLTMVVFTLVFGKFANFPSDGVPYPHLHRTRHSCPGPTSRRLWRPSSASVVANQTAGHEGLLPARAAAARRRRSFRSSTSSSRSSCSSGMMVWFRLVADLARSCSLPRSCHGARHGARRRPLPLGGQRALPRRPVHGPVHPPALALRLRRSSTRSSAPGAVAVAPLAKPDDGGHQRLPGGLLGTPAPDSGRRWRQHRRGRRVLRRRPLVLPPLRAHASRTRSDGRPRSASQGLSKRYRIGQYQTAYGTLRDALSGGAPARRSA